MADKPSYEELEQRVKELENEALDRRQLEKDLKIYKSAVESSINAIGITDLEGKLIYVNDSCVKMWGYNNKNEILGRLLPEFWEGDGVFKTIKELQERGVASGEDVGKRNDGSLFFVRFTANMFKDEAGNPSFMFGSFSDITERKQVEISMRENEERFRMLFEDSPISLWEEDFSDVKKYIDGLRKSGVKDFRAYFENHPEEVDHCLHMVKILAVNRSTLDMYQAKNNKEFLSGLEKVFTEESYDLFREELIAIAEGRKIFEGEGINQTFKGERKNISLKWSVAPGHEETLSKVFVSIIDITDLKRTEKSLREAYNELEHRVMERTKDLEIKTNKLEEVNTALRVLIDKRDEDKINLEKNVLSNVNKLVFPYLYKTKKIVSNDIQKTYLKVLESSINEIISPFVSKLSSKYINLTPAEIHVADFVKHGKRTKEIATLLDVSVKTIESHRDRIRKKIGIKNKKTNLRTYLLSLH